MKDSRTESKKFHGWKMVFVFFILMFTLYPPLLTSVSIFNKPVSDALGLEESKFLLYNTIKAVFTIIGTLMVDGLVRKLGAKKTVILGIVFSLIGILGFAFSRALIHFYFFAAFMGFGLALTCMVIPSIVLTNWFNEKRGSAIGIALAGSGLGGSIYSPVVTLLMTRFGWQMAFFFTAAVITFVTLTVVLVFFVEKPEYIGQKPLGESLSLNLYGHKNHEMLRMSSFYAFAVTIFVVNLIVNGISISYTSYFELLGYDAVTASMYLSIGLFSVTFAKLFLGIALDKLGPRATGIMVGIILVLLSMFLLNATVFIVAILFCISFGITSASTSVLPPIITENLFGNIEYGKKFGIVAMLLSLSTALAPIAANTIKSVTGNPFGPLYFYVGFGLLYVAAMILTFTLKKDPKEKEYSF